MKDTKKKYLRELEKPGETLYFYPVGKHQQDQVMVWGKCKWLQWRGRKEGLVTIDADNARSWLRIHGHLEMPSREQLDKEHEDRLARFEVVVELAMERFKAGVISREEVISSLITEVKQ